MSKKNSLFVKRPEPPSFSAIIEDVAATVIEDVVFSFVENLSGTAAATPTGDTAAEWSGRRDDQMTSSNSVTTSDVESVYRRTADFMSSVERLRGAPDRLRGMYESVRRSNERMCQLVESLRQQSRELRTFSPVQK